MKERLLDDRTAIVTGASKGIGRAIAELFADEGAKVVLTARGEELLDETVAGIVTNGGTALGIVADSTDPDAPRRVFGRAIKALELLAFPEKAPSFRAIDPAPPTFPGDGEAGDRARTGDIQLGRLTEGCCAESHGVAQTH